jgi:hypothetical protein
MNFRPYFSFLLVNLFGCLASTSGCKGDGCMVYAMAFLYFITCVIVYLPYIFYSKRSNPKLFKFILPSILMLVFFLVILLTSSDTMFNWYNVFMLLLIISPNSVGQILYYLHKKKLSTTNFKN